MANGRTVKLDGVGTFYHTANASGNGVDSADEVKATQIPGVRMRFIPEVRANSLYTSPEGREMEGYWLKNVILPLYREFG